MARRDYLSLLQRDQVLAARTAGTPIPDGTGRLVRNGVIVSASDNANALQTQARNATLAADTGPRPLGGYEGDSATAATAARLDPRTNPNLRPGSNIVDPAAAAMAADAQRLLSLSGLRPDRNITPQTIARATPAQISGELSALDTYQKAAPGLAAAATERATGTGVDAAINAVLAGADPGPATLPPSTPALPPMMAGRLPSGTSPSATTTALPRGAIGALRNGSYQVDIPGADGPQNFPNERAARIAFAGLTSPYQPGVDNAPAMPAPSPRVQAILAQTAQSPSTQPAAPTAPATPAAPRSEADNLRAGIAAFRASGQPMTSQTFDLISRAAKAATERQAGVDASQSGSGKLFADADALESMGKVAEAEALRRQAREGAPRTYMSPEEAGATEAAKITGKGLAEENLAFRAAGAEATRMRPGVQRAMSLIEGGTRTGAGANLEVTAKQIGSALGIDFGNGKLANMEELQSNLGDRLMERISQTKGAVSDFETQLFVRISASMGKTPEGNLAILRALDRKLARDAEIATITQRGLRSNKSPQEINSEIYDYILAKPIFTEEDAVRYTGPQNAAAAFSAVGAIKPQTPATPPTAPAGSGKFRIIEVK